MKEVKVSIGGKEYSKTRPTVLDLRRMAEYQEAMQFTDENGKIRRKNVAVDKEAQKATFRFVAGYVGAPSENVRDDDDLFEIFSAMRDIDNNIAEALTGESMEKNGEGQ